MAISKITASVLRSLSKNIIQGLADLGIDTLITSSSRSPYLEERSFLGKISIADDPTEYLSLLVPSEDEDTIVSQIITSGRLDLPGRGSVFAQEVELPHTDNGSYVNKVTANNIPKVDTLREVTGICCVVQRSQGNPIGHVVLDAGAGVPNIQFGTGFGVRDKMGLLRITISPEKEILWTAISSQDADVVFDSMIKVGKLDQPAKGFIYTFPLTQAHLNIGVMRGIASPTASLEQIIVTIDKLFGDITWRKRIVASSNQAQRTLLLDQVNLTLYCNEGSSDALVSAAMAAGAGGATIAKVKSYNAENPLQGNNGNTAKACEMCSMIIAKENTHVILDALTQIDCFTPKHDGLIVMSKTNQAFTYLPPPSKKATN